jgi:hypothetical protein
MSHSIKISRNSTGSLPNAAWKSRSSREKACDDFVQHALQGGLRFLQVRSASESDRRWQKRRTIQQHLGKIIRKGDEWKLHGALQVKNGVLHVLHTETSVSSKALLLSLSLAVASPGNARNDLGLTAAEHLRYMCYTMIYPSPSHHYLLGAVFILQFVSQTEPE